MDKIVLLKLTKSLKSQTGIMLSAKNFIIGRTSLPGNVHCNNDRGVFFQNKTGPLPHCKTLQREPVLNLILKSYDCIKRNYQSI